MSMTVRDIVTTVAGMVVVAASAVAGATIWLLLTSPTTLSEVLLRISRYL